MKHTSLPWSLGGDGADIFGPGTAPGYADSAHVADCQDDPGLLGMGVEDVNNAQFIVKACNSHYDLLESLKDLFGLIEDGSLVRDISKDHESGWTLTQLSFVKKLKAVDEAIKKAEGEA